LSEFHKTYPHIILALGKKITCSTISKHREILNFQFQIASVLQFFKKKSKYLGLTKKNMHLPFATLSMDAILKGLSELSGISRYNQTQKQSV